MNCDDWYKLDYLSTSGHTLNVEERSALQTSLQLLKRNCKFKRVHFWGKVFGTHRDYLIAQGFGNNLLRGKKSFCSHDGVEWVQLPDVLKPEVISACDQVRGRFSGDPSTETTIEVESDDKKKQVVTLTEEKRLARLIHLVDRDAAVIPKGAFILTADHNTIPNPNFHGLSAASEAEDLKNYLHFREPENLLKKSLLQREGLVESVDFLDNIAEDIPKGCWALNKDRVSNLVTLRSLHWLGLTAFHVASTPHFGYCYFGYGEKNSDIGFML